MNLEIILLTETWCNDQITDMFLKIPGYELQIDLRRDRMDTRNGKGSGLLVYAKNGVNVLTLDNVVNFNQHCTFKVGTDVLTMSIRSSFTLLQASMADIPSLLRSSSSV